MSIRPNNVLRSCAAVIRARPRTARGIFLRHPSRRRFSRRLLLALKSRCSSALDCFRSRAACALALPGGGLAGAKSTCHCVNDAQTRAAPDTGPSMLCRPARGAPARPSAVPAASGLPIVLGAPRPSARFVAAARLLPSRGVSTGASDSSATAPTVPTVSLPRCKAFDSAFPLNAIEQVRLASNPHLRRSLISMFRQDRYSDTGGGASL